MGTAGDGNKSRGSGEKFQINEEPQNLSQELGQNNLTRVLEVDTQEDVISAATPTMLEALEQMLKQITFTRSESQRLIAVLHSRTIEELPCHGLRVASTPSVPLEKHKHEDERDNFHPVVRVEGKIGSPRHPTTMENLSDELLSYIFIRLLAKQLAQMRSVSKSWNAFLCKSSFIKSHLHHSIHNKDQVLLVFHEEPYNYSYDDELFTAYPCRSPHFKLTNFINPPVRNKSEYGWLKVIGSVNGLICYDWGWDSAIYIWNPSLSTVLTLPPYATPACHTHSSVEDDFRFGFDPKNDDYKVVKLSCLTSVFSDKRNWWLEVEVYSMRKGSWELITSRVPSHIKKVHEVDYVCGDGHDGRLHWFGEVMDSKMIVILAFDMGSETFYEIPLPDPVSTVHLRKDAIGVLGGNLCMVSRVKDEGCEVWVMDEYGVAESWVKRHSFSHFDGFSFGFTSRNEFLFGNYWDQLVLYDPITNKAKCLDERVSYFIQKYVEYVDSLIWVTPVKCA